MNHVISIGPQESFLVAICVLFLGQFINTKLPILKKIQYPRTDCWWVSYRLRDYRNAL